MEPEVNYRLILSEVYYDGTDEWIEITNIGDGEFSGKITLSGAKASVVNVTNVLIHPGASMIFGDNLSQITGDVQIGKTGLALNLVDTVTIDITGMAPQLTWGINPGQVTEVDAPLPDFADLAADNGAKQHAGARGPEAACAAANL